MRGNAFVRAATGLALVVLVAAPARVPARPDVEVNAASLDRPGADAVALGDVVGRSDGWHALAGRVEPQPPRRPSEGVLAALGLRAPQIDVQSAVLGDVDGDGDDEIVVVFLRPQSPTMVGDALPVGAPIDGRGRSQHVGVYDAADLRQVWVAGTVLRPVSSVAVCEDALLLGYTSALGAVDRIAVGVVTWRGYGFVTSTALPDLPGDGVPACADVDGHGRSQPVVLRRAVP